MGERLVFKVIKREKQIATIYYHWSGYTGSIYFEAANLAKWLQENGFTGEESIEKTQEMLLHFVQQNGGGVGDRNTLNEFKKRGINPKEDGCNRNYGLLDIEDKGMTDAERWGEDWLDKFVDSQAVDIIRKAVNESARKTSKHYMADLIATMAINGATKEELDRAIKYSAAVIDAERARKELGIDELEKKYMSRYPLPTTIEVVTEKEDSPIEYEPKTYEEEFDAVDAFFDKYDTLIDTAPRNSLLGMLNDLDNAMVSIEGHIAGETESYADLKEAKEHITHVSLILAQMWSDENQDIELTCVDPATGEEMVYTGPSLDPGMQFVADRMNEIGKEIVNKHKEEKEDG